SANNRLSTFNEMRLAATLQKGVARSGDALSAAQVLAMGTANGAHATGQPVGTLTAGAYADLVAVDLADLSLQPAHDLIRNVVYAMEPVAIRHVYVHGRAVVRDGRLVQQSERAIVERVRTLTAGWSMDASDRTLDPE
ncbi:MAG: amidohydrolase family protein, partial [Dehalococcoidia bacterium]